MSAGVTALVVVAAVIVVAVLVLMVAVPQLRRRRLRRRFGPEYHRSVAEHGGSVREAERDLRRRERLHRDLDIKPLSPSARDGFLARWAGLQEGFVDHPERAVVDADQLLTELMRERGYPTDTHAEATAALSVQHAGTLQDYRAAHATAHRAREGSASTEELREAVLRTRSLFAELIEDSESDDRPAHPVADAGQARGTEQRAGTEHGKETQRRTGTEHRAGMRRAPGRPGPRAS